MVSVTSEVLANASFQSAAARSARPDSDQSARNDSFAALVDSNTAASNNDNRTQDNAPAPRRSDDSQAASDSRARDNAASDKAASDKAARNDSNDRNAAAKARDDAKADAKVRRKGRYGPQGRNDPLRQIEVRCAEVRWQVRRNQAGSPATTFRGKGSDRDSAGWNGRGDGRRHCRRQSHCCRAGSDGFHDPRSRQGDSAAGDRGRGDRRLRFAGQRDRAGCSRT